MQSEPVKEKYQIRYSSIDRKQGKHKTNIKEDRVLKLLCNQNPFKTAVVLQTDLRRTAKKPFLSQKMKIDRLTWALLHQHWSEDYWRQAIWADERNFNLYASDGLPYIRRKINERFKESCTIKTVKHSPRKIFCSLPPGKIVKFF